MRTNATLARSLIPALAASMLLIFGGNAFAPATSSAGELHTIFGTFQTADGVPYAGVPWLAEAADKSVTARGTTDAAGNFSVLAPTSSDTRIWFANASILGWQSGSLFCDAAKGYVYLLVRGDETRLDIRTQATHDVTVVVTDKFGKPVRNAFVAPGTAEIWDGASGPYLPYGASTNACHATQPQFSLETPLAGTSTAEDGWTPALATWIGGWIPGKEGGNTPSTGTVVIATPGLLPGFSEDFARVLAQIAPGVTQRTTVPMSAIQGSDEWHRVAVAELPYAPIMEDASTAGDVPGEPVGSVLRSLALTPTPQVLVRKPSGEPLASTQVHIVPVLSGDTPTSPREGVVVATAMTGADGRASFTGLPAGQYRAIPGNVAARTVDFSVAVGSETPPVVTAPVATPPVVTPPIAGVTVKPIAKRSKLFVDVNPNKGSGYWTFKVQKRTSTGSWKTLTTTYKTYGKGETRTLDFKKGTYRVVVKAKYGYLGTTSAEVYLKK